MNEERNKGLEALANFLDHQSWKLTTEVLIVGVKQSPESIKMEIRNLNRLLEKYLFTEDYEQCGKIKKKIDKLKKNN